MTPQELLEVLRRSRAAEVQFTVTVPEGSTTVAVPLAEVLTLCGMPPPGETLWVRLGDRIGFSLPFLEQAADAARQHPEGRTTYVELTSIEVKPDGGKVLGVRKHVCAWCHGDLDEAPHARDDCPKVPGCET